MAPLVVDPCGYLKPHHSVGHCHISCKLKSYHLIACDSLPAEPSV